MMVLKVLAMKLMKKYLSLGFLMYQGMLLDDTQSFMTLHKWSYMDRIYDLYYQET